MPSGQAVFLFSDVSNENLLKALIVSAAAIFCMFEITYIKFSKADLK